MTNQLFEAALSELAVVAWGGSPAFLLAISTWSPRRYLVWRKASLLGSGLVWRLLGLLLLVEILQSPVSAHGTPSLEIGGIFRLDAHCVQLRFCPAGSMGDRWVQPHLAVRTWFAAQRWTATVTQPCRFTPLWPASWVSSVDQSRDSRSAEVRRIWETYDERLGLVRAEDVLRVDDALGSGDVSCAWVAWSTAETALAGAYRLAGGPDPERGFILGRGIARFSKACLGGRKFRKARARCADPGDGAQVDLYRDCSIAPLVDLRRRLRAVLDTLAAIGRSGFTVSGGLELTRQWDAIVAGVPKGTVTADALVRVTGLGLAEMEVAFAGLHQDLDKFLQGVVRHRKERAVQGWKTWILEDPLVHPYRWLRPDLVPPSPFLQCDPGETAGGFGVLADPALIDAKFRKSWMPYFCRSARGAAC